jgi:hypothetical protein
LETVRRALFLVGATPKMGFYFLTTKKLSGRVVSVIISTIIKTSNNFFTLIPNEFPMSPA